MEESEHTQNGTDDFKKESCKNLAQDFDTEVDDLFTKLGDLSPSNSSFDSPLLLNRTNKIAYAYLLYEKNKVFLCRCCCGRFCNVVEYDAR